MCIRDSSDTHFFSRRLYSDCPDFTIAEHSDRKMFRESGDIIKKAMDEIVAYQPDLVILSCLLYTSRCV